MRREVASERTLRVLDFPAVIEMLVAAAASPPGKALAAAVRPSGEPYEVGAMQRETSEARRLLESSPAPPMDGVHDVVAAVRRAALGSALDAEDLLRVMETARAGRLMKRYCSDRRDVAPALWGISDLMDVPDAVEGEIGRCVTPDAEVADNASERLARVRRVVKTLQNRTRERLESLVRSADGQRYLQEPVVTVRDGRYVVPVKKEYRSRVPGVVHDQSSSGATLFVEPMFAVALNNELRQALIDEKREVERVLSALSALVGGRAAELESVVDGLAGLDLAFAKARLGIRMRGCEPELSPAGGLDLKQARHPLLKGEVVPVDVCLGRDFDVLVITGPNTGGKTVTLKTIGLLSLMAQCGLHVPAEPGTGLAVFPGIFCDLGDEQSIEQSLSTFSSHMGNIVGIVASAGAGDLVLLDEIGAGTDPAEGSALAMALLERFHSAGSKTVATTHYSELKGFAYSTERMENASVEFDPETLSPRFRLVVGVPGRSNAFEISARLGLPDAVIERARRLMSGEELRLDSLLREAALERERLAGLADEHERRSRRLEEAERVLAAREEALRAREHEVRGRSADEARELVRRARRETERVVRELRSAARLSGEREREEAARAARDALEGLAGEIGEIGPAEDEGPAGPPPVDGAAAPAALRAGDAVFIRSLRQRGYVLEPPGETGEVHIQAGILRLYAHASDLARVEAEERDAAREELGRLAASKAMDVSPEVSLRGMTVADALEEADKYLDDACLAGLKEVRIIHGKGTGALRRAVTELLRGHQHVESFRDGEPREGGLGVTVARLKG